jgi:hypothetical protein
VGVSAFLLLLEPGSRAANSLSARKEIRPEVLDALAAGWGGLDAFEKHRSADGSAKAKDVLAVFGKVAMASAANKRFTAARVRELHQLAGQAANALNVPCPSLPTWAERKKREPKIIEPIKGPDLMDVLSALNHLDVEALQLLQTEINERLSLATSSDPSTPR